MMIRTEYDNSIVVTKMVLKFFFVKLRRPTGIPIKSLPKWVRWFPMNGNRN